MAQLRAPNSLLFVLRTLKCSECLSPKSGFALPKTWARFQSSELNTKFLPGMDRYTKRKSEYRIPGMNDNRVRERHILLIPGMVLCVLVVALGYMKWLVAEA